MAIAHSPADSRRERRAKYFWITFILGFFAIDLTIAIVAIVMATSDPSFRPMPDYGDRAVDWEGHRKELVQSRGLGWQVSIAAIEPDRQAWECFVRDRSGQPIQGANGTISAYHLTRASLQKSVELNEVEPGRYRGAIDCSRAGWWKIELRLTLRDDEATDTENRQVLFVEERTIEVPSAGKTR